MTLQIIATLGPSSLNLDTVQKMEENGVSLFRLNLSHTLLENIEPLVRKIQSWTDVPLCLDSEGAQVRNNQMISEQVFFKEGDLVKINHNYVLGDDKNISFTPKMVSKQIKVGDKIKVDFNSVCFCVTKDNGSHLLAIVEQGGYVGSNKASDINRDIYLDAITPKDKEAFKIGLDMGLKHFSLSFTNSAQDVIDLRKIIGYDSIIISKIESIKGVMNLNEILPIVDRILIDRGDLSREVDIAKIPFLQRKIISSSQSFDTPVYVATNLLESMIKSKSPTRAEVNDIASTLLMGASGLVLAAETAIGKYPVESVKMAMSLINQYEKWTPETSSYDIIYD